MQKEIKLYTNRNTGGETQQMNDKIDTFNQIVLLLTEFDTYVFWMYREGYREDFNSDIEFLSFCFKKFENNGFLTGVKK